MGYVSDLEQEFKAIVVWLILNGKIETMLETLAKKYKVSVFALKVGPLKRK
jgi:hypothetical protein